jgi:TetR/AcrR family transcriptional repressor of nem operon
MPLGRPIEFDPDQALQAAMEVFWRQGYEATSLQDLLQAMRLSKSSFYQAFGSKHELFQSCLAVFRDRQVKRMMSALHRAPSGREFLRSVLRATAQEAHSAKTPKGCLIMNTATEFSGRDPEVAELVADGTREFAGVFRAAVVRAQEEGEIAPDRNPEVLAHYVVSTVSGLKTMVKAGLSPVMIEEVVEVALGALH